LLYISGNWTIKTRDTRKITAAEMKYTRKTRGYTCTDYKRNREIAIQINTTQFWSGYRNPEDIVCKIQTECPLIE